MWLVEQLGQPSAVDLEDCLSMGMVRSETAALAFRHELARRALEDSLTSPRRQSLHAKVLSVLAQREDVPVARLAHHADGAHDADQVLRFAPIAAEQAAAVGAHSEALAHYQVALKYGGRLPLRDRAHLLELLSYECYLTGQHERAIEPRRQALEICGNRPGRSSAKEILDAGCRG